jgi:hypothetical protein
MPEEEHKAEHQISEKEPHGKKSNHLLWWGLGIGAAGLLITLYLATRNSGGGGTTVQASQPFTPNPTDVSQGLTNTNTPIPSQYQTSQNATSEDYWPPVPTNNQGQTQSSTSDDDNQSSSSNYSNQNNQSQQSYNPPPVQLPSHNAYVYTTQQGDTLASLTNKFHWGAGQQTGGGPQFTYNYGNNAEIFSALGINPNNPNQAIPAGTQIAA